VTRGDRPTIHGGELVHTVERGGAAIATLARSLANLYGYSTETVLDNLFAEARARAILGPPRREPQNARAHTPTTLNSTKKDTAQREAHTENEAEATE